MPLTSTSPELSACRILFGSGPSAVVDGPTPALHLAVPSLGGAQSDVLFQGAPESRGGLTLFLHEGCLAGFAVAAPAESLEAATDRLYRELLGAVEGLQLYRIWNYVPHINADDAGLEAYRRFSRARSLVFEERFGAGFAGHLPAASAVGAVTGGLALAFIAGPTTPRRFENPRQVPAYAYPAEHGPRAPSFCRALRVSLGAEEVVFISGTAAIRGHASMASADFATQARYTVENLEGIAAESGAGPRLAAASGWQRRFTVYLRHPAHLAEARTLLAAVFASEDHVCFVQADICRSELLIEIECTLRRPR